MAKTFIEEGYGPPGLVDLVRKSKWDDVGFWGIELKNSLLVQDEDRVCSQKYRARFFEVPESSGDSETFIGYQDPFLIDCLRVDDSLPVTFACRFVLDGNNKICGTAYRLVLEEI